MSTDAVSLPDDPAALRALLLREREQHTQVVAHFEQTVRSQEHTIRRQEQELARLLRRLYGPRQERIDPDQLTLFDAQELQELAAELQQDAQPETDDASAGGTRRRRRRGQGRQPLPAHLPREQVVSALSEDERRCPCCGEMREEIGRETSEQLEFVPASYKVIEHVRLKYACRRCQEHVAIAPPPSPKPIDKGLPGPGLLAQTVLAKYGDHVPLYRQEDIATRHGIVLRRSTLCGWIAAAADLAAPLYERLCALVRQSRIIHTDDTSVKLLDGLSPQARTARFWAYIGDRQHPYTAYHFTDSRKRDGPAEFLAGFAGYLQADAYGVYDGLYRDPALDIVEVACWAHCRRYWWEARMTDSVRAHEALAYIARLYRIEDVVQGRPPEEVRAARQAHALPILAEFRAWLERQQGQTLPKHPITQALTYTLNQWDALQRYCEDGELTIDNNLSERTVKVPALGRKNWLFVASHAGGRRAAILFSLVASCKANGVEPWAYLRDVFARLPSLPSERLDELLPDVWLAAHPEHRWQIDDLRRAERRRKRR